jgi:hypothetical protein
MLAQINASHRFNSFAEERSDNVVKWYADIVLDSIHSGLICHGKAYRWT